MSAHVSLATLSPLAIFLFLGAVAHATAAEPVTLDFDNLSVPQLVTPYSENGFTVSVLSYGNGGGAGICGGGGDGALCGGTNTVPLRFRITGETAFDLLSLDVEAGFRNWRIESSSGAIVSFTPNISLETPGTIDFDALPGWRGLSYFEIVHDPGEANGYINVDNIRLSPVPEPSTLALVTALAAIATNLRRRHRPASTN